MRSQISEDITFRKLEVLIAYHGRWQPQQRCGDAGHQRRQRPPRPALARGKHVVPALRPQGPQPDPERGGARAGRGQPRRHQADERRHRRHAQGGRLFLQPPEDRLAVFAHQQHHPRGHLRHQAAPPRPGDRAGARLECRPAAQAAPERDRCRADGRARDDPDIESIPLFDDESFSPRPPARPTPRKRRSTCASAPTKNTSASAKASSPTRASSKRSGWPASRRRWSCRWATSSR
jgi:hypothetical protein